MEPTTTAPNPTTAAEDTTRQRLTHSLQQMVDEANHLLKETQRTGTEQFTSARAKLESQLHKARTELRRLEEDAVYNTRRAARATDHAVHEHPYAAMGITAAAGLLIGMLIARR